MAYTVLMCINRSVPGTEYEYRSYAWFSCCVLGLYSLSLFLSRFPQARTVPCPWSTQSMRLIINPPLSPSSGTNPSRNADPARESLSVRDRSASRAHAHARMLQGDQNRSRDGKKVQSRSPMAETYQQVHWSRLFFKNIVLTKGSEALDFTTLHQQNPLISTNAKVCKIDPPSYDKQLSNFAVY